MLLNYQVNNGVAEIAFNAPPVNAITAPLMRELLGRLEQARTDSTVRAVILASDVPGRFCAGLHLSEMVDASLSQKHALVEMLYQQLFDAQMRLGKPSIAAVRGTARGGGMTLAVSCDMLVAAETATFGYPEIDVGVTPAIHYTHLPRIVGRHVAFELLFTGRTFDANEALRLGLVNAVVPEDDVLPRARAIAQVLAAKPPHVLRLGREAFYTALDTEYRKGVANAVNHFAAIAATDDAAEGIRAFTEKRRPVWPSAAK